MADLSIQGYLEAMEKYDIPVDQDWILEGESSRMAGYRMMQMLSLIHIWMRLPAALSRGMSSCSRARSSRMRMVMNR